MDTSSTKMRGFEEVHPCTTLQLTGQCGFIQVGLFLHSPNLDHGPQDSWRSTQGRLSDKSLVLLLPVRYSCLGARGGGEEEEALSHRVRPLTPRRRLFLVWQT